MILERMDRLHAMSQTNAFFAAIILFFFLSMDKIIHWFLGSKEGACRWVHFFFLNFFERYQIAFLRRQHLRGSPITFPSLNHTFPELI